jgi:Flp pilus assembly protein TadG
MRGLARLAALRDDRSGAVAVMTAFLMIVALGFVGLGVDVGTNYAALRQAQGAADSAAFTAGVAQMAGNPDGAAQARAVVASYGMADATVTVNTPPTTGLNKTTPQAVEVIITRPGRAFFSRLFGVGASTISARAVAAPSVVDGNGCLVAFNDKAAYGILNNGTGAVNLKACSLYVNSNSAQGLALTGTGSITGDQMYVHGPGYWKTGTGALTVTGDGNAVKTNQTPAPDPYDRLNPNDKPKVKDPTMPACTYNGKTVSTTTTFDAGGGEMGFCNGLNINAIGATVTFKPGTYYVSDQDFRVNGANNTIIANNATFVLTNRAGGAYAHVVINGTTTTLNMTAPTGGDYAGLIFYQDRRAPTDGSQNTINGKANVSTLRGAVYIKKQTVTINGVGLSTGNNCIQVLADKITFNGAASTFGADCSGVGTQTIGSLKMALVE